MNDTIAIQNQLSRLEKEMQAIKQLLRTLVAKVEQPKDAAGKELLSFLDEVHKQLPDIPVEEAERDIMDAVQAVRRGA